MTKDDIKYRKGYKYQLHEDRTIYTSISIDDDIHTPFISMTTDGMLTTRKGYAWDGASWAIDTKSFMRGSLFHDALYQLIRQEYLGRDYRHEADLLMRELCIKDGMWRIRVRWIFRSVRRFGKGATIGEKPVLTAP